MNESMALKVLHSIIEEDNKSPGFHAQIITAKEIQALKTMLENYQKLNKKNDELAAKNRNLEKWCDMTWEEWVDFDIAMEVYGEFNDTLCAINEHLGDIYGYKDLKDAEEAEKYRENELYKKYAHKLLKKVDESYDYQNLMNWYITFAKSEKPIWTEEHIKELLADFDVFPKWKEEE